MAASGSLDTPGAELNTAPQKSGASGLASPQDKAETATVIVEVGAVVSWQRPKSNSAAARKCMDQPTSSK